MDKQEKHKTAIGELPTLARKFREWSGKPYFRAQVNANVYLGKKLGNMLLAGEPQKNGALLYIPVHHGLIGWDTPVGSLFADAKTLEVIDDDNAVSKIKKTVDELHRKGAFQTGR